MVAGTLIAQGFRAARMLWISADAAAVPKKESKSSHPKSASELFYDRLARKRVLFLSGGVDDASAKQIVGQLLALEFDRPGEPITLFITSRGGRVYAGLGIIDTMRFISSPVRTVCVGHCESMGAIILAAGEPGQRYALPHSRIMLHAPFLRLGGTKRTADDVRLQGEELTKTRSTLLRLLEGFTHRGLHDVERVFDRDTYLSATEAQAFGIVDHVAHNLTDVCPYVDKIAEDEGNGEQGDGNGDVGGREHETHTQT